MVARTPDQDNALQNFGPATASSPTWCRPLASVRRRISAAGRRSLSAAMCVRPPT